MKIANNFHQNETKPKLKNWLLNWKLSKINLAWKILIQFFCRRQSASPELMTSSSWVQWPFRHTTKSYKILNETKFMCNFDSGISFSTICNFNRFIHQMFASLFFLSSPLNQNNVQTLISIKNRFHCSWVMDAERKTRRWKIHPRDKSFPGWGKT